MNNIANYLRIPKAYLITFTCYGMRLHGKSGESVDRFNNIYNSPFLKQDDIRFEQVIGLLKEQPYYLDDSRRKTVLQAIKDVCHHYDWYLYAAHIRTDHVHLVVQSQEKPEIVLHHIKSFATKYLNSSNYDGNRKKRWSRHGSTRYLWKDKDLEAAIHYVLQRQGRVMEIYDRSR